MIAGEKNRQQQQWTTVTTTATTTTQCLIAGEKNLKLKCDDKIRDSTGELASTDGNDVVVVVDAVVVVVGNDHP